MQAKIQRWGNSLAVRIPKAFAQDSGMVENSPVEMTVAGRDLIISPRAPRPFTLQQLLDGITDDNLHDEIPTGAPVGNEVW